jgi:hypothetical protein
MGVDQQYLNARSNSTEFANYTEINPSTSTYQDISFGQNLGLKKKPELLQYFFIRLCNKSTFVLYKKNMNLGENISCGNLNPKTIGSTERKVESLTVSEINLNGADLSQTLGVLLGHAITPTEWGMINNKPAYAYIDWADDHGAQFHPNSYIDTTYVLAGAVPGLSELNFTSDHQDKLDSVADSADATPAWVPVSDPGYLTRVVMSDVIDLPIRVPTIAQYLIDLGIQPSAEFLVSVVLASRVYIYPRIMPM